ncbi:MAG: phenylalanine--tRNA ligase subunit beta [Candidatus Pacebacteria bacterium]|nr:phenylalanine--tRNA ligase subunit beta [Candidatus Paceibacterota bacterium]
MVFSYNWLQSFFIKKLPGPDKLAEILTMNLAEVEEVKKEGQDFILDIDVRPNRAGDCFSHLGIAREIAAITDSKLKIPDSKVIEDRKLKAKDFVSVEIKDKAACPRYTARAIADVKVGPSPKWLKDRLATCGLRPINSIVDIANYVMLETGQPLHAFDAEKLAGKKIIVRYAKNKEKIVTLDEQKFDLNADILVIADGKSPVAIAGIKGGKLPEIEKKTKNVILESANFDHKIIRKGSRSINLKTDASLRFEHGLDPNLTEFAINRAAFLMQKIARGKIAQGLVDVYPKKVFPKRIKLDLDYVDSLLGTEVPLVKIKNIYRNLNFRIISSGSRSIMVEVPTIRLDVSLPEDLIEEIGRIYGYDKIPSDFPISSLILPKRNLNIFWEEFTKNVLKEAGFSEVYNYSFFGEKEAKIFGYKEKELIEVGNPLSQEQKYLRASLIPNLVKDAEKNFKHFNKFRIFELGKIFKAPFLEKRQLAGLIIGEDFYQLKGTIDLLLQKMGISDIWYDEHQATPEDSKGFVWHPKKCAEIKIDNQEIGFLGEISPKILSSFNLKEKAVLFDVDFEKLSQLASEEHEYRPLSRYPAAVRDISILVPGKVKVVDVLNEINTAGGKTVRDVDLFDVYEGEELPGNKKNLAFHIIFQAEDRTLSPGEIDEMQNKIIKALESNPEWQVRKQ